MNQKNGKNSLGIDKCFEDLDNPIELFDNWFKVAKSEEINDPNALALATSDENNQPNVRMVLLKGLNDNGFVFYTNLTSKKGKEINNNKKASMCFHWKSIRRQVRILGKLEKVSDNEANNYFESRPYKNKIGAWASTQSKILKSRDEFLNKIKDYEKKYPNNDAVPRPEYWSGWRIKPKEIEFWLDGQNRIHERLKYIKKNKSWKKVLLSP